MIFERAERAGLDRPTIALLLLSLVLALLHHTDHALRVDHSGWPFREAITPFTYSLLAYPTILFALFGSVRSFWARWASLAGATAFTIYAHTAIESPRMQFVMWANNHSLHEDGLNNALDMEAPILGILSVGIGMALNITAVIATGAMFRAGLRKA